MDTVSVTCNSNIKTTYTLPARIDGKKWRTCVEIPVMIGEQTLAAACQKELSPLVSFTLLTWVEVVKDLNFSSQIRVLRWAVCDSEFIPNQIDSRF